MESSYVQAIRSLREVPKVKGSFLLAVDGVLLGKDMPSAPGESLMQIVGTKLLVLAESMDSAGDLCTGIELQYAEHTLVACRVGDAVLCVLTEPGAPPVQLWAAMTEVTGRLAAMSR